MSTCLVTGGAGFMGSHLVEALLSAGDRVRVLDNFSTGSLAQLGDAVADIELIVGDVASHAVMCAASEGADLIFHLAPPVLPQIAAAETLAEISLDPLDIGSDNVLRCALAAGVRRVVFASSARVYHSLLGQGQCTPYAAAKLAAEKACASYASDQGLETVCLRYFNVYGPRQAESKFEWDGVLPFLRVMGTDHRPMIRGSGCTPRDVIYIEDAIHATLLASQVSRVAGMVYDVGSGRLTTMLDVLAAFNAVAGLHMEAIFAANGGSNEPQIQADAARTERELGFCPCVDLQEGLRRCIADYRTRQVNGVLSTA